MIRNDDDDDVKLMRGIMCEKERTVILEGTIFCHLLIFADLGNFL